MSGWSDVASFAQGSPSAVEASQMATISRGGVRSVFRVPAVGLAFPAAIFVGCAYFLFRLGQFGLDFDAYLSGCRALIDGHSPYQPEELRAVLRHGGGVDVVAPVYPPLTLILFAPFLLLPHSLAVTLFVGIDLLCVLAVPRVLGVSGWRASALVSLTGAGAIAVVFGSVTPLLMLGLAWLWRVRDRDGAAAATVAVLVAAKLFLWPLALWLVLRGRVRAGAYAALLACALVAVGFLPLGIDGVRDYATTLGLLARIDETHGYSVVALTLIAGHSVQLGTVFAFVAASLLALLAVAAQRRGDELLAFTFAILVAFAATPIVWAHYFLLLLVPLIVRAPVPSVRWLVVLPLVPMASSSTDQIPWLIPLGVCFMLAIPLVCRVPIAGKTSEGGHDLRDEPPREAS